MSIQAPQMDEEDQLGPNMPKKYMCNACKAVVWHLDKGFLDATHGLGKKVLLQY